MQDVHTISSETKRTWSFRLDTGEMLVLYMARGPPTSPLSHKEHDPEGSSDHNGVTERLVFLLNNYPTPPAPFPISVKTLLCVTRF